MQKVVGSNPIIRFPARERRRRPPPGRDAPAPSARRVSPRGPRGRLPCPPLVPPWRCAPDCPLLATSRRLPVNRYPVEAVGLDPSLRKACLLVTTTTGDEAG